MTVWFAEPKRPKVGDARFKLLFILSPKTCYINMYLEILVYSQLISGVNFFVILSRNITMFRGLGFGAEQ